MISISLLFLYRHVIISSILIEISGSIKPTDHAHNQGEIGELGDDHRSSQTSPLPPPHTTSSVTLNNLVKALASMKTWNTPPTEEPLPSPHFRHYRKGIPTPLLHKKSHHRQEKSSAKPTKSFRSSLHGKETTGKSNKQHSTEKHYKTKTTKSHRTKSTMRRNTTQRGKNRKAMKGTHFHPQKPTSRKTSRSTGKQRGSSTATPSSSPTKSHHEDDQNNDKLKYSTPLDVPLHDPRVINVLCFGDSLTAGYNKRGKDFFPYCSVLKDMLASQTEIPINVDIKGIVGEMTHKQMSYRLPLVLGNATAQYDWIIILGGTNDILHVKNFADDQYFLSQLENVWQPRITKDIEKLHQIAYKYDARTLLLTVPENSIESWPEYRLLKKMRVKINEALRDFAETSRGKTVLCDTARIVPRKSLSSEEESLLWDDHVHMTRDGYVRMARAVAHCILPYIPKKKNSNEDFHSIKR